MNDFKLRIRIWIWTKSLPGSAALRTDYISLSVVILKRRKIRLREGNAKCCHLKELICKGTLRQEFICLRPRTPYTLYACNVYMYTVQCRRQQNQRSMCEDLLGYSHKQAKQKTEESGLLISRILLQQVWRIYCPQTRTLNITIVRDNSIFFHTWKGGRGES